MVTEILNPFIKTRNQIKKNGRWVDQSLDKEEQSHIQSLRKSLKSGDTWTLIPYWIGKHLTIDSIEVGTTSPYLAIACMVGTPNSDYKNNLFQVVYPNGGRAPASPTTLLKYGNSYMKCEQFTEDEAKNIVGGYKMTLKQPIHLPQGGKIVFSVLGDDRTLDFTYSVKYRELKKNA